MTMSKLIETIEADPNYREYDSDGFIPRLIYYVDANKAKGISPEELTKSMTADLDQERAAWLTELIEIIGKLLK